MSLEFSRRFKASTPTIELGKVLSISTESIKPQEHAGEIWEHYSIPAYDENRQPLFELSDGIKSNKYAIDANCILISKLNPATKRIWMPSCTSEHSVCSTEFIVYKPKNPRYKSFYYAAIDSQAFTDFLIAHVTGSTGSRQRTQPKATLTYPMPNPGHDAIEGFCAFADPIYKQIQSNKLESKWLVSLRDALLPKLMSGEIDVSKIDFTQLNSHLAEHSSISGKLFPLSTLKGTVMENAIQLILAQMQSVLNSPQLKRLKTVLTETLPGGKTVKDDSELLPLFLTAKEVEGCSSKTIEYYRSTLSLMTETLAKPYTQIESDDLRKYLNDYEASRGSSKVTIDNIRRIMSSFFSWLEDEDYIVKSPVRRIHRVKTVQVAKEVLTDEDLETLRNTCDTKRDLAVIDLLVSTGMRIGELVKLNIEDVNLAERECLVMGKGNKQRPVYFDARTKLHLEEYLHTRADHAPALFVALDSSARRVTIGNLEQRLRKLGKSAGVCHVHPHKFRRTLATHAIDKGMPIEQVQKLLGHAKIDTTMHYAMVNQNNVKASHRKYLE